MVTPELTAYVRQQLGAGMTKDAIKTLLSSMGWNEQDMNDAFLGVGNAQSPQPSAAQPSTPPAVSRPAPARPAASPAPTIASQQPVIRMPERDVILPPGLAATATAAAAVPPTGPKSHTGVWIAAAAALLIIAAGGFAAYYLGVFSSPAPAPAVPTTLPVAATGTPSELTASSSAAQAPAFLAGSSTLDSLTAGSTAPSPTATLTINNATSTVATASTFTLKWSSTNADTFSATQSVSGCLIPALDTPDTTVSSIASAHGTKSLFVFTKSDLALLAGCSITVTYTAGNATSTEQAQAAATISFPSDASTTQALINMTSLRP